MTKLDLDARVLVCSIAWALGAPIALGCGDREPAHTVAPAPAAPAAEPAPAAAEVPQGRDVPGATPAPAPAAPAAEPIASAKPMAKPPVSTSSSAKSPATDKPAREKPAKPAAQEAQPPAPAPAPPAPAASEQPVPTPPAPAPTPPPPPVAAPEPAKASKVTVPSTEHVSISMPKGMQALLDADTRMQPWVNNVVAVADRCYKSKAMGTSATIVVDVTMHKNARPDADIQSLPGSLSGVVACATGDLMRAKRMPLFTGPEGERHTLKIKFK